MMDEEESTIALANRLGGVELPSIKGPAVCIAMNGGQPGSYEGSCNQLFRNCPIAIQNTGKPQPKCDEKFQFIIKMKHFLTKPL